MNVATSRRSTAGIREVKNHLSAYLDRVRDGEEIVITDRGRPVARLTTVTPDLDRLHALIDEGTIKPSSAQRSLPRHRVRLRGSVTDLAAVERR